MIYSRIIGTGSFLPEKILTNAELEKHLDTSDEWILERTGIKQRHIASPRDTAASMGTIAAKNAMTMAGIKAEEIDQIIVATATSDKLFPSCACFIQYELGIKNRPAFDVGAACAGFNYALGIADQFIRNGSSRCILVVGSETLSRVLDWNDRATCILLADGAGAVILRASEEPGIHSTHLAADGQYQELLYAYSSVSPTGKIEPPYMKMQGSEVFKVAVKTLGDLVTTTLKANGLQPHDIDWLIPHQANLRIIQAIAKKLDLSMDQVVVTIQKHGNTSAASIPLALDEAVRDGRIKRGHKLLLESFGSGFTWGSALITY